VSDIVFNVDHNGTGLFYCGSSSTGYGSESCSTETLTKAPEIDRHRLPAGSFYWLAAWLFFAARGTTSDNAIPRPD
jgi:hypothetical protein